MHAIRDGGGRGNGDGNGNGNGNGNALIKGESSSTSLLPRSISTALQPLQNQLNSMVSFASSAAMWTVKFWVIVFTAMAFLIGLLCFSFLSYLLFYQYLMPTYRAALPVHFDVSSTLVPPHATVMLQGERQWRYADIQNLQGVEQSSKNRYLAGGHSYNAYLELVFPDSAVNRACGMQSVEMLVMHEGILLASSLHSFTPSYSSPLVRWMRSWALALPLVTGILQEQQTITLHMFDSLTEQEAFPTTAIKVLLKSPSAPRFQLYSATLRLQVQLFGLRYLMYHHWLITGTVLTFIIFSFQLFWSTILVGLLLLWCFSGQPRPEDVEEEEAEAEEAERAERMLQEAEERKIQMQQQKIMAGIAPSPSPMQDDGRNARIHSHPRSSSPSSLSHTSSIHSRSPYDLHSHSINDDSSGSDDDISSIRSSHTPQQVGSISSSNSSILHPMAEGVIISSSPLQIQNTSLADSGSIGVRNRRQSKNQTWDAAMEEEDDDDDRSTASFSLTSIVLPLSPSVSPTAPSSSMSL